MSNPSSPSFLLHRKLTPVTLTAPGEMAISNVQFSVLAAAAGVGVHVFYFRHGEHHQQALLYLRLLGYAVPIMLYPVSVAAGWPLYSIFKILMQAEASFLISLLLSLTVYRLSPFHRLASFPGPVTWRWSKFAQVFANRHLRGFEALDELHRKYGDYVRTGTSLQLTPLI